MDSECACVKLSLIVRYRDSHLNFECACVQMCLTQCVRYPDSHLDYECAQASVHIIFNIILNINHVIAPGSSLKC